MSFYWLVDGDIFVAPHEVGCISCMHFLCITMRASDTRFLPSTRFLRASWQSRSEPSRASRLVKIDMFLNFLFDLFNYSLVFFVTKEIEGDWYSTLPAKSDRLDRQNQQSLINLLPVKVPSRWDNTETLSGRALRQVWRTFAQQPRRQTCLITMQVGQDMSQMDPNGTDMKLFGRYQFDLVCVSRVLVVATACYS